jgi:hypothetical protein
LLTPIRVPLGIDAFGWELDLTSSSFESMLQQELVQSGGAIGNVEYLILKLRHGHSQSNQFAVTQLRLLALMAC